MRPPNALALSGRGPLAKHLTGVGNYDGIRHFMEGFGPLTLMASHGALLLSNVRMRLSSLRRRSLDVLLAASVILPLLTTAKLYPYLILQSPGRLDKRCLGQLRSRLLGTGTEAGRPMAALQRGFIRQANLHPRRPRVDEGTTPRGWKNRTVTPKGAATCSAGRLVVGDLESSRLPSKSLPPELG